MPYAEHLRQTFPTLGPEIDDLFLLEAHQIGQLPARAPAELGVVLRARPDLHRFLVTRHPPISDHLDRLVESAGGTADVAEAADVVVWELADWIVYQRAPELYDASPAHDWDFRAVTDVVALDGRTVIDVGSGTGRVAFAAAATAATVFAVEPVTALRAFIREKAARLDVGTVFAVDGTLDALPLPTASADVVLTCRAIGWSLAAEMAEIERVVRPGGSALHLLGSAGTPEVADLEAALVAGGYVASSYADVDGEGRRLLRRF